MRQPLLLPPLQLLRLLYPRLKQVHSLPKPPSQLNQQPHLQQAGSAPGSAAPTTDAPLQKRPRNPCASTCAQAGPDPRGATARACFIDGLMDDPTIPLAGAAILALLLGYGGYRVAQRRKAAAAASADSSLGDSQLAADSFFAPAAQRVDTTTSSSQMSGQSMQYSPSQLDAGDVDPWPKPTSIWPMAVICRPRKSSRKPCAPTPTAWFCTRSWQKSMPSATTGLPMPLSQAISTT